MRPESEETSRAFRQVDEAAREWIAASLTESEATKGRIQAEERLRAAIKRVHEDLGDEPEGGPVLPALIGRHVVQFDDFGKLAFFPVRTSTPE